MVVSGGDGRIAVLGSSLMLSDGYIEKEDNLSLVKIIFSFLLNTGEVILNQLDADEPDITDYTFVPDHGLMSNKPRACIQRPATVCCRPIMLCNQNFT